MKSGRSIEEPEHPAWTAWLEHTGFIPGTTMGIDSGWHDFKGGWEAAKNQCFNIAGDELIYDFRHMKPNPPD